MTIRPITTLLLFFGCACASGLAVVPAPPEPVEISVGSEPVEAIRMGEHSNHYEARIPVEVCNRYGAALRLRWIELRHEASETGKNLMFDAAHIGPGECLRKTVTVAARESAAFEVKARVKDDRAERSWTLRRTVQVVNPERDRRVAECHACDGDWGAHGMLGIEGCICRTGDKGATCYDGGECEGICLYEGFEVTREAEPVRCDEDGACSVSLSAGRPVGRCSEFQWMFGCYSYIPDGTAEKSPFVGAWSVPRICVD